MSKAILQGAILPIAWAFPLAAVTVALYRFPIPLAGYRSGPDAILPSLIATAMYGGLGGFPLLAAVGSIVASVAKRRLPSERSACRMVNFSAPLIAAIGVGILANLDYFIGRW